MKKSRFSEEQIIGILREQEARQKTAEICQRHGISEATFYARKAKDGGLEVSETKRLKGLENENSRPKKLLTEAMLDNAMLREVAEKKW
ncbi:transposase [Niveispirillum sp. SYP-B3756]|nr:transposase [Niveispirillum sp. SYP-B3756]